MEALVHRKEPLAFACSGFQFRMQRLQGRQLGRACALGHHAGGVAFTKSSVGRAFHQFYGENTLRSDLSISVPELGSLLDHTGPIKAAEAEAAQNFGADHTFFVTNGTSTANKIVWHGTVGRGDVVFVDRNCHKSLLHALVMTGAELAKLCAGPWVGTLTCFPGMKSAPTSRHARTSSRGLRSSTASSRRRKVTHFS